MEKNLDKGQHFLVDENILRKKIEISNLSNGDRVIEIGFGNGIKFFVFTRHLFN